MEEGPIRYLVVVPAFNEEDNIAATVREIRAGFPEASILVVNDGSRDGTSLAARKTGVAVLDLPFNLGIGACVQTALKYALDEQFDIVLQVDGDGQHPADQIGKIVQPILEGRADMVIGSRFLPGSDGFRSSGARRLGIRVFRFLNRICLRQKITDSTSGFRAFHRSVLPLLAESYPRDYPEPESIFLLARRGFRIQEVPVAMRPRQGGKSSIRGWRDAYYMLKVLLALLVEMLRRKTGGR